MLVQITSIFGKTSIMDLDVTVQQLKRIENGEKVQNVVPHLNAGEREFLINGITPEDYKDLFGE